MKRLRFALGTAWNAFASAWRLFPAIAQARRVRPGVIEVPIYVPPEEIGQAAMGPSWHCDCVDCRWNRENRFVSPEARPN